MPVPGPIMIMGAWGSAGIVKPCDSWTKTRTSSPGARRRLTRALADGAVGPAPQRANHTAWHRRFNRRITLCRAFHHALVNPGLIDLASTFKGLAPRLLAACFAGTRDARVT